jgi:TonB-dependent receptor
MKINKKPLALAVNVASLLLGAMAANSFAQETEATSIEEVTVTGVRRDLLNAQAIKRDADTFVDAISAKDIGSLPDKSVLEAISRIPGVSIERFAGVADPNHFGTEGSGAVVRGITQTRTEFNGRDAFSANSGRGLSFEDVPPELAGGVSVYKNQSADLIEGGIGGTISLRTRLPFDEDGQVMAITAEANYGDIAEETSGSVSALYSNRWETGSGEFGFLINLSDANVKSMSQGVQVDVFTPQDNGTIVPQGIGIRQKSDDRERQGTALALQWASRDETMVATAQFVRSDAALAWTERSIDTDEVSGDYRAMPGTEFSFNGEIQGAPLFESGVLVSDAGWRGNDSSREPGGLFGLKNVSETRQRYDENLVDDFSFNLKYSPNERWDFNFDVQYVEAEARVADYTIGLGSRAGVVLDSVSGDSTPNLGFVAPDGSDDPAYFSNPANYFIRHAMDHLQSNEGEETAVRLDTEYHLDNAWVKSIEAGVRWAEREQITRESDYNWGLLSEAWSGGGAAWYDADKTAASGLQDAYDVVSLDDFSRGDALNTSGGSTYIFPSINLASNYAGWSEAFAGLNPEWAPLAMRSPAGDGLALQGAYLPSEINTTTDTNNAAYIKLNFDSEVGGLQVAGNVGFRYVSLENTTNGFVTFPDYRTEDPSDRTDADNALPADDKAFGNAATVAGSGSGDYSTVLPSLNLKVGLTDDLIVRFAASKAIALPDLGALRYHVGIGDNQKRSTLDFASFDWSGFDIDNVDPEDSDQVAAAVEYLVDSDQLDFEAGLPLSETTIDFYTAGGGNPALKPMESEQYDVSLEWYFADVGSLTGTYFYKEIDNYFLTGSFAQDFTNNGVTKQVFRNSAINGGHGRIQGFELAYQQFFDFLPAPFDGLGIQANYTYVDEDGAPLSGLKTDDAANLLANSTPAFDNLPLEGLSKDTFNFTVMYEKENLSARLAYNWRSRYLLTSSDVITNLPIYNDDNGQLDASIFYHVNDNVTVGLQVVNVLDTTTKTLMQVDQQGRLQERSWFVKDRTAAFVVKALF